MTAILPPSEDARARARAVDGDRTATARAPKIVPSLVFPTRPGLDYAVAGWWECFATIAAWRDVWVTRLPVLTHRGIAVELSVILNDAAADGDVRIRMTDGAGLDKTTGTRTYNGGPSSNLVDFNWLHGEPIWTRTEVTLSVQAFVRAAGAGFGVFSPYAGGFVLTDGHGATLTGL